MLNRRYLDAAACSAWRRAVATVLALAQMLQFFDTHARQPDIAGGR